MPAFWSCRGSKAKGWLRRFCPLPLANCPMTGTAAKDSRQFCWRPLLNTSDTRALVIGQRWINVGRTAGRGKKSTSHDQQIPAKDIWLYRCVKTSPLHFANQSYGLTEYLCFFFSSKKYGPGCVRCSSSPVLPFALGLPRWP